MNAIELLKTPFYISNMNNIIPLTKINIFYSNYASEFLTSSMQFISILTHTTTFVAQKLVSLAFLELNTEIVLYIMCIFTIFMLLVLNDHKNSLNQQTRQIESLESRINYLKKMERMREELVESWIQDIKLYQKQTNNKFAFMDRKIKKIEKDLKIYE
jgi:hypothetical protein